MDPGLINVSKSGQARVAREKKNISVGCLRALARPRLEVKIKGARGPVRFVRGQRPFVAK